MGCAGEETVAGITACHSVDQFWEYSIPSVSCGPAHGQQVDQVLFGSWDSKEPLAHSTLGINPPVMGKVSIAQIISRKHLNMGAYYLHILRGLYPG